MIGWGEQVYQRSMWLPTTDYWYVNVHVEQEINPLKCKNVHSVKQKCCIEKNKG